MPTPAHATRTRRAGARPSADDWHQLVADCRASRPAAIVEGAGIPVPVIEAGEVVAIEHATPTGRATWLPPAGAEPTPAALAQRTVTPASTPSTSTTAHPRSTPMPTPTPAEAQEHPDHDAALRVLAQAQPSLALAYERGEQVRFTSPDGQTWTLTPPADPSGADFSALASTVARHT